MPEMEHHSFDEDFDSVIDRLVADRPQIAPVDLDRIKLQALGRGASYGFVAGPARRRILAPIVTMGLMGGGTAAVLAAGGDAPSKPQKIQCVQYHSDGTPKLDKNGNPKIKSVKTCKPPNQPL